MLKSELVPIVVGSDKRRRFIHLRDENGNPWPVRTSEQFFEQLAQNDQANTGVGDGSPLLFLSYFNPVRQVTHFRETICPSKSICIHLHMSPFSQVACFDILHSLVSFSLAISFSFSSTFRCFVDKMFQSLHWFKIPFIHSFIRSFVHSLIHSCPFVLSFFLFVVLLTRGSKYVQWRLTCWSRASARRSQTSRTCGASGSKS